MGAWEQVAIGILGVLVLFWIAPGIKPMLVKSKEAPTDWTGFLIPIALVVLFIVFLASTL